MIIDTFFKKSQILTQNQLIKLLYYFPPVNLPSLTLQNGLEGRYGWASRKTLSLSGKLVLRIVIWANTFLNPSPINTALIAQLVNKTVVPIFNLDGWSHMCSYCQFKPCSHKHGFVSCVLTDSLSHIFWLLIAVIN